MPLLRFESSRDLPPDGSAADYESARDQFVAKHRIDFQDDSNLQPRLPNNLPFFALPEQQLLAYEKHREESELGHVFRIANGLHDHIDALVVFGSCGGSVGGQAIYQACCDPYHNEFSRAARGSKPRIYFADAGMDNDQLQSLLGRLRGGGYGDGPAENRWAVIVSADIVSADELDSGQDCSVLDRLLAEQIRQNDPACQQPPPRSVTLIGEPTEMPMSAAMLRQLTQKGFEGPLRIGQALPGGYRVLTPVALLPAAFLGLDCIQLLVGAAAINENFCQAPFESNLVLQFAAANGARAGQPTAPPRQSFAWWARSLSGLDRWRLSLNPGQRRPGEQPWDIAIESHGEGFCQLLQSSWFRPQEIVVNHVVVDAIRTDPLRVEGDPTWLPARQSARQSEAWTMLDNLGVCQNTIHLPVVDTHSLGQLMQMMMLASALSSADHFGA